MKKIFFGVLILIIGICLVSGTYAISQENNITDKTVLMNESQTQNNYINNNTENTSSNDENSLIQNIRQNNIPSNVPKIIIKDGKEYINTTHGQYPVKYTENGKKYYQIDKECYYYKNYLVNESVDENGNPCMIENGTKYLLKSDNGLKYMEVNGEKYYLTKGTYFNRYYIDEYPIDENGNEYIINNGTKYFIKYDNGSRYWEVNGEKHYITQIMESNLVKFIGDSTRLENITQLRESNMTSEDNTNQSATHGQNLNITSSNNEDIPLQSTNKTVNQDNSVQLESTGIPIAILLIAIIGSVIGFKRKK